MADYDLKTITPSATVTDGTTIVFGAEGQAATPQPYTTAAIKAWIKSWIAKADVALGNVDNTSDVNKPVSTAQGLAGPRSPVGLTNVYYVSPGQISAQTVTALRFYMMPVYWPGGTATNIAFTITTAAAAGKVARVGLFNMKTNGLPGTLVGTEPTAGGAVAVDVTGTQVFTISQALAAGWYYLGFVTDGGPSMTASNDQSNWFGASLSGTAVGVCGAMVYRSYSSIATAFSDESAQTFTLNSAGTARPMIGIK